MLTEHAEVFSSKGELRRAVKNNAVAINKEKMPRFDHLIGPASILHDRFILGENGKKNQFIIELN